MTVARKLPLAVVMSLGVAWAAPAWAESKKDLVAKLVHIQQADAENIARGITGQALQPRLQAIGQAMASVPAEKKEALTKEIQGELKKSAGEIETILRDKAVKLAPAIYSAALEDKFSEDELRQIIAWLESPAARKYQQYGVESQGALVQKLVAETRGVIEPKLKALDERLKGHFSAVGTAARSGSAPAATPTAPKKP